MTFATKAVGQSHHDSESYNMQMGDYQTQIALKKMDMNEAMKISEKYTNRR